MNLIISKINLNLSNQSQFRLNKINQTKDYFISEIQEREAISEKLNKYIAAFDYFNKTLIVLSAASGVRYIASFTSIISTPVGIASASFNFVFSLTTGTIKTLLKIIRNKKKKHNKTIMLARSELNSIEIIIFQALIDSEISHEE